MRKRSICAGALDMFAAQTRDLYHIEFTAGKYIDFAFKQKYRIAEQYIDKAPRCILQRGAFFVFQIPICRSVRRCNRSVGEGLDPP